MESRSEFIVGIFNFSEEGKVGGGEVIVLIIEIHNAIRLTGCS